MKRKINRIFIIILERCYVYYDVYKQIYPIILLALVNSLKKRTMAHAHIPDMYIHANVYIWFNDSTMRICFFPFFSSSFLFSFRRNSPRPSELQSDTVYTINTSERHKDGFGMCHGNHFLFCCVVRRGFRD